MEENKELQDEVSVITLVNDDGDEANLVVLDVIDYEGDSYVVLEDEESYAKDDEAEVTIMKLVEGDGGEDTIYEPVFDEELEDKLFGIFLDDMDAEVVEDDK